MKKKICAVCAAIMMMAALCISCSATEYYGSKENESEKIPEYIESITVYTTLVNTEKPEYEDINVPIPLTGESGQENVYKLTPEGNLTLVDDVSEEINSEGNSSKEFLTVETKNGNIFYIIVDRDKSGNNVHFLNMVDEADLMALISGKDIEYTTTERTTEEDDYSNEPVKDKKNSTPAIIILLASATVGIIIYLNKDKLTKGKEDSEENIVPMKEFQPAKNFRETDSYPNEKENISESDDTREISKETNEVSSEESDGEKEKTDEPKSKNESTQLHKRGPEIDKEDTEYSEPKTDLSDFC